MRELDCEEGWGPKNWCFWTLVFEKTPESPLDCKEIQPVHSRGDQPWDFFGRTDAEAETLVLWPPHVKSWLIGKDSDAGRDWGQEEKGTTEDEMASLTQWTWVWVNSRRWWWTGRPGVLRFMGLQRVGHDWATQLNWISRGLTRQVNDCLNQGILHWAHKLSACEYKTCVCTSVYSIWEIYLREDLLPSPPSESQFWWLPDTPLNEASHADSTAMLVAVKNTKVTKTQLLLQKAAAEGPGGRGREKYTPESTPQQSKERTSGGLSARRLGLQRKWSSCSSNQAEWPIKPGGAARVGKKVFLRMCRNEDGRHSDHHSNGLSHQLRPREKWAKGE